MIICPNCQRENEDEYKYCLGCGTVLPRPDAAAQSASEVDCANCGAAIPPNFKFCGECGTPVAESAPPGGQTSPPAQDRPTNPEPPPTQVSPPPEGAEQTGEQIGHLVVIKPDGTEGAKIPITDGEVKLGRSSEYEVLSSDPFLSPHHASLVSNGSGHLLRDASSLNGVFIRITTEVELQDADYIRLGQELLQFHFASSVEPVVDKADDEKTLTAGSPDNGFWGRLSLISGPQMESRGFVFADDEIVIGREVGDIVFRDDGFVSGRHARIARVDGKTYLKDLGSSNGTYVRIRGERHVGNGDLILMGQQLFRVEL